MVTILFPRKGDRLRAHSVFFQAMRVAASGIGVISGMVPARSSATALAVSIGTYRNGNTPGAYAGGSLTSVPAASSGKLRFDLVVFDVSDTTLKRIPGSEDTPIIIGEFLENSQPQPPELASASQILLGVARVSANGIEAVNYGHYATDSIASMIIELPALPTRYYHMEFPFGDGSAVLIANGKYLLEVPITGTIVSARVMSGDNTVGSIIFVVCKKAYGSGIPTDNGDRIYVPPYLTNDVKVEQTGLNISITQGDLMMVNIYSVTSLKTATLSLRIAIS